MEKSGFVAGAFLPDIEKNKNLFERAMQPVEGRDGIITVTPELLKNGAVVVVVWNIKQHTAEWKYINSHLDSVRVPQDKLEIWKNWRRLPSKGRKPNDGFRGFIHSKIGDVKPDAYGLPGGQIEEYEYEQGEAKKKLFAIPDDYENGGEHFSDYSLHREWVEETGFLAIRERKALFERVIKFYEDDNKHMYDPTMDHGDYFFWVRDVVGKMKEDGVEGETLAPEIVPITSLHPGNFYKKHAHGLTEILTRLVNEYGMEGYKDALKYLKITFRPCQKLRKYPKIRVPELAGLSDEEVFAYAMAQDKVTPLKK